LPQCVPSWCRRYFLSGPRPTTSTGSPAARRLTTRDQRRERRVVCELCFQLIQRCRRELALLVEHDHNRLPVALLDAQTALDVRQQGFGATRDCQGRRDIGSGTADSQIPDLSAQRSTLLFQHAVQLSFAAVEFFGPGLFELFDIAGLPSILFALQAGLVFGVLARLVGGFLLVQQLLNLGFQA
jgi:hypothetical protein